MTFPRLATRLGLSFRDGELGVIIESEGALFGAPYDFGLKPSARRLSRCAPGFTSGRGQVPGGSGLIWLAPMRMMTC
jgi:hypothetical protein